MAWAHVTGRSTRLLKYAKYEQPWIITDACARLEWSDVWDLSLLDNLLKVLNT